MNKIIPLAAIAFCLAASPSFGEEDCLKIAVEVKTTAQNFPDKILEEVSKQVSAYPNCACEIVKAAIEGTSADEDLVAAIVETAVVSAPDQMRIVAQCAVAVAPDALAKVQAVLAKLDRHSGESDSAKSAKSAKGEKAAAQEVANMGNPLDFPGKGPIGPLPIFSGPPGFFIPPVDPPPFSPTDPQPN